jgi:hypothetical protein
MTPHDAGHILDLKSLVYGAAAKIDIFEPDRVKLLIEAAKFFPNIAPDHEEGSGRLFDKTGLIKGTIQIPILAIHRIRRPQPVDPKEFEDQRCRCREPTDREPGLSVPCGVHQFSRCHSVTAGRFPQRVNRGQQIHGRVQKEDEFGIRRRDALIHGSGKSAVGRIGDHARSGNAGERGVLRCVIDDDGRNRGSHFSQTLEARLDHFF